MEPKHTAGPWESDMHEIRAEDGTQICVAPDHYHGWADSWHKNESLLCAAPEMYQLLDKIFKAGQRQPEYLQGLINDAGRLIESIHHD